MAKNIPKMRLRPADPAGGAYSASYIAVFGGRFAGDGKGGKAEKGTGGEKKSDKRRACEWKRGKERKDKTCGDPIGVSRGCRCTLKGDEKNFSRQFLLK